MNSITSFDRKYLAPKNYIARLAKEREERKGKIIALVLTVLFAIAMFLHVFVEPHVLDGIPSAHAEEVSASECRTNKECCDFFLSGAFYNSTDNAIVKLCKTYE